MEGRPMTDLIIVGAGPAGLSCAIEAKNAGLTTIVLEKGSLVDYIRRFPKNLIWFSTPELLEIGDIPFPIPTVRPTRVDAITYYQRVTTHFDLDVRSFDAVERIDRVEDYFSVTTAKKIKYEARNVVVATGYFDNPNRLDVDGEDLPHVKHYYDEPFEYFDRDIVVVGGRNSAVESALDLFRHGARVTLVHRGETLSPGVKYWILPDIENRIKSGEIKAEFNSSVSRIKEESVCIQSDGKEKDVKCDVVFVLIGFRPDTNHLKKFGIAVDAETLAPLCVEGTFETKVPGLFVAGSVVAGKFNNKIFVENGRLHGKSIVALILSKR